MKNFPYYSLDELKEIKINSFTPDDMTVPYGIKFIKDKRIKNFVKNFNDVFAISTSFTKPSYHFKLTQEVDIDSLYFPESRAICLGSVNSAYRGQRVITYYFQFI